MEVKMISFKHDDVKRNLKEAIRECVPEHLRKAVADDLLSFEMWYWYDDIAPFKDMNRILIVLMQYRMLSDYGFNPAKLLKSAILKTVAENQIPYDDNIYFFLHFLEKGVIECKIPAPYLLSEESILTLTSSTGNRPEAEAYLPFIKRQKHSRTGMMELLKDIYSLLQENGHSHDFILELLPKLQFRNSINFYVNETLTGILLERFKKSL